MNEHHNSDLSLSSTIGIIVDDLTNSRLLESAAVHLGLKAETLGIEKISLETILQLELIIADEPAARQVMESLHIASRANDPYRPAVVAVVPSGFNINDEKIRAIYDGVLPMPQLPDALAAQLSVALYSHRAFARRYGDQMEELQLNRSIFGSVASGISVANASRADLPLAYVNPSFEALTGYTLEEVRDKNCRFLQREDRDQPGLVLIREAIRDGKSTVAVIRNYRKDGTAFWNELALSPIRSKDGEVTHFIGIQADVTQRVEFEQALRETEKLAVTGRLAAAIAHEINNPLESISNLVYLAQRTDSMDEVHGYLSTLESELKRVTLITAQALRFSRQYSKPEIIDASDLLHSALDIQISRIRAAGVAVAQRNRFCQSFVGMESEIRQVLNNLITNGTDALRGTGGTLHIRTRHATDWKTGKTGVLFTVADRGTGMSVETQNKLFQAFYTTKGQNGTGLGLWVSSEIVKRHHGRLTFRSREGGSLSGTIFQLFLPYQAALPVTRD